MNTQHAAMFPAASEIDRLRESNAELLATLQVIAAGNAMKDTGKEEWTHAEVIQQYAILARAAIARATGAQT